MARLSVLLLGPLQIILDGEPATGFVSDKVRALLAYLAVETRQPHRREKLAGLLWPDWPETSARASLRRALANLRQALHRLRASIGDSEADLPCLHVTRETIACHPPVAEQRPADASPGSDRAFWLDVAAFRAALNAVGAHAHAGECAAAACCRRFVFFRPRAQAASPATLRPSRTTVEGSGIGV